MSFPVSISFPPPIESLSIPPPNVRKSFRERPKGLWKGRVTPTQSNIPDRKEKSHKPPRSISDTDDDEQILTPPLSLAHHPRPLKKRRADPLLICTDDLSDLDIDVDSADDAFASGSHNGSGVPLIYPSTEEDVYYWDYSRQRCDGHFTKTTDQPKAKPKRPVDTTSTAQSGAWLAAQMNSDGRTPCNLDDWEDLKDLFSRAAEHYEGNDTAEALPLLRGVIHECHRFLSSWPDPSVLFVDNTPPETPLSDAGSTTSYREVHTSNGTGGAYRGDRRCSCFIELPTAFHALLGTALFLFGNVIGQDPSLVLEGEPPSPVAYWLAALDVFETGENLPSRTRGGQLPNLPEDWRMAIVWGRTLVCLAEDLVNRQLQAKQEGADPSEVSLNIEEPKWPEESPFYVIAAQRQPITRRMSFNTATPNDLLILAMDQFSRGIFHMPHPQNASRHSPVLVPLSPTLSHTPAISISTFISHAAPSRQQHDDTSTPLFALASRGECSYSPSSFSRARQLYTIAREVLHIAEKLEITSERQYWASWADSVLRQMGMETYNDGQAASVTRSTGTEEDDVWRLSVTRLRARCRLVIGSAYAEEIESALESGQVDMLRGEDADEAREDLGLAIELFERAKAAERGKSTGDQEAPSGASSNDSDAGSESENLGMLLTEALITLANLTEDPKERDALYARAKVEAGSDMDLDLDLDPDEDDNDDHDVRMDESH